MSGYIGPIPVPQGIQNKETFTATAGQTTFNTNGYTDGAFISVYLNGVRLINGTDYTATNGSDFVLTQAASVSDVVDFETFNSFSLLDQTFDNVTLKNPTHEDTDGGRESTLIFKGEQSGGEISTLAAIQASHDGTADDQKGDLIFKTNDGSDNNAPTERMRIDSSGNVGIAKTAPTRDASTTSLAIGDSSQAASLDLYGSSKSYAIFSGGSGELGFYNLSDSAERMRIDSSGNLLVGHTSQDTPVDNGGAGVTLRPQGVMLIGGTGTSIYANREDSDGEIVQFRKDGTTVGSIGTTGGNLTINSEGAGGYGRLQTQGVDRFIWYQGAFYPNFDNLYDLGGTANRFDDVYATNGTIQTSDRNEKQQIASLTDAEMTAAKAISKLFKTFKWNDSVAEKGDAARTHTGVIAQDVEQAMTDAGLNAGDYAFFISTTWWETQTEVPAVEADEENGIEAKDAYTRTDTYDTLEEAPEGATERNRKGIRYPQLLSFIGAATEQRLASIESRLDALEAEL